MREELKFNLMQLAAQVADNSGSGGKDVGSVVAAYRKMKPEIDESEGPPSIEGDPTEDRGLIARAWQRFFKKQLEKRGVLAGCIVQITDPYGNILAPR